MIYKSFEILNIDLKNIKLILLYGKNEGLKKSSINKLLIKNKNFYSYDEKEILDNEIYFFENTLNKSLFEKEKTIIINRATNKILKIVEQIDTKKLDDILIIINAENLEKKSKLRNVFEKGSEFACVPFYPDNDQTLNKIASEFLNENKISLSQSNLNFIISKCAGNRENLVNELNKIKSFIKNGKKINFEILSKLINLSEEYNVQELVDNYLAKNINKVIKILNENNFTNVDNILIIKSLLNKVKKLFLLCSDYEKNNNINQTILNAKPPIFWKDKEITKQQINNYSSQKAKELIYKLNDLELQVKRNSNSQKIVMNFLLDETA